MSSLSPLQPRCRHCLPRPFQFLQLPVIDIIYNFNLYELLHRSLGIETIDVLTPKTNAREEKWKSMKAAKDENLDHESIENQSVASDCTTLKSVESFNKNNFNKKTRYSFDSMDDSVGRQSSYSSHGFGRKDSIESNES
ncbi:cingulin-like isoform X1 [Salvia divinorum]|uniref:Cingulin-like isoform X1 n=1 Tax=Salvia divinorum TaxID=28513 RepID=A0ABD1GKX7_SALDI